MKKAVTRELSACETLIMKVVWDAKEDIAVQELIVQLKEQYGKDYARTTVVTFLGKMADKGFVSTHRRGKNAFVHAEKNEDAYKSKLMNEETDFWFEGQTDQLLSAVCSKRTVSKEEIQRMRDLLDSLDK
ncbi:MAG: BlaI/MecI/CopY family transcriptional regulator [Lachnobacterium sp.]|nr:BlaI/MecI/CopY family transcriptional regulator [Lachnobacterium sp.]MCI7087441.1 BlaI/MecI/CopY family transcriptional regulator [Lachnobacterium sp.]